jgi:hypothetical protein
VLRSHGEVAVLQEGAPEQGHVDQGEDERLVLGGVHEGARGSEQLAVAAHGGGAAAPRKGLQAQVEKNYLWPDVKRGNFTDEEDEFSIRLHNIHGNKYVVIYLVSFLLAAFVGLSRVLLTPTWWWSGG